MIRRAFKIPLSLLLGATACLLIGELLCGTNLHFAILMAITVCAAGITYNVLGGMATFSGMLYAVMAACSVVISQFVKILLLQPADSHIAAPNLTAAVYATFFVAALFGSFTFRQIRLPLPHPAEPKTDLQSSSLYILALVLGLIGDVLFNVNQLFYSGAAGESDFNVSRSVGVALIVFLTFAEIIAVDLRIRKTGGRHSFGMAAFIPWVATTFTGLIDTQRGPILAATAVYFFTCYFRGYRFRIKHYAAAAIFVVLMVFVVSPLELYTRTAIANQDLQNRVSITTSALANADLRQVTSAESALSSINDWEDYYWIPGAALLSRFSLIRLDSNLIAACSNNHYGFTSIKSDLLYHLPHFLYPGKPEYSSNDYLGRVSGVSAGIAGNSEPTFTVIADSFGSFGLLGAAITGYFLLPLSLRVLEEMFDVSRPWGTVAFITVLQSLASTVGMLIGQTIRTPIYIVLLSYLCAVIAVFGQGIAGFFFGSEPNPRTAFSVAEQTIEG